MITVTGVCKTTILEWYHQYPLPDHDGKGHCGQEACSHQVSDLQIRRVVVADGQVWLADIYIGSSNSKDNNMLKTSDAD